MAVLVHFNGIAPVRLRLVRFERGAEPLVPYMGLGGLGDGRALPRHDEHKSGRHQGGGRAGPVPRSGLHEGLSSHLNVMDNVVILLRKVQ